MNTGPRWAGNRVLRGQLLLRLAAKTATVTLRCSHAMCASIRDTTCQLKGHRGDTRASPSPPPVYAHLSSLTTSCSVRQMPLRQPLPSSLSQGKCNRQAQGMARDVSLPFSSRLDAGASLSHRTLPTYLQSGLGLRSLPLRQIRIVPTCPYPANFAAPVTWPRRCPCTQGNSCRGLPSPRPTRTA